MAHPEDRDGSPLDFTATYLPPNFTMQFTVADSCDGRVASLGTVYTNGQRSINIARWTMRVFRLPSVAPHPVQVAGKPGVRLGADLLLVEEWGMTAIEVSGLPYEETVKIAEGLRTFGRRLKEAVADGLSDQKRIEIARQMFTEHLEKRTGLGTAAGSRLVDYLIESLSVYPAAFDARPLVLVHYSVLPATKETSWIAGNGEYAENGWIVNKVVFLDLVQQDGVWRIRQMTTSP